MKAEITFKQLYWNKSLLNFFFRTQAEETMQELVNKSKDQQNAVELIDAFCEDCDIDLDTLEEDFYDSTVEELAELFGIELDEEEDKEDE